MRAGELHVPVVRLFSALRLRCCSQVMLELEGVGPGFTLPANIGDLDQEITQLNLSGCNLTGNF